MKLEPAYYCCNKFPIASVAFCFREDPVPELEAEVELSAADVVAVLLPVDELLPPPPVSISVAFCLIEDISTAKAMCVKLILAKDAAKINVSAKPVKTVFLLIVFNPNKSTFYITGIKMWASLS
jgi:hypothetical protein